MPWSDGIHYVRPTVALDKRPQPWCFAAHRVTGSEAGRWTETEEEAIFYAKRATREWLAAHPDDAIHLKAKVKKAKPKKPKPKPRKVKLKLVEPNLPTFSTYHFTCIAANPIAQVWQCTSLPGERGQVGRPSLSGRPNKQSTFKHAKGQCAVLLWKEPLRDENGEVRVFTYVQALNEALHCFDRADDEERIYWEEGHKVVARTLHVDICFDPACNGEKQPFNLWVPFKNQPVYAGYQKREYALRARNTAGAELQAGNSDELAALAFNRKLKAMATEESKQLSLAPATFESIWGAFDHAENVIEPHCPKRIIL